MKLWNFLNGKKTYIGAGFFLASCLLNEVGVGIWHIQGEWVEPTIKTFEWFGMAFTSTGFFHKLVKNV